MGLRALYFLLADMANRFHLLKFGLAFVLMFVSTKMMIVKWMHVPTNVSLLVIGGILARLDYCQQSPLVKRTKRTTHRTLALVSALVT